MFKFNNNQINQVVPFHFNHEEILYFKKFDEKEKRNEFKIEMKSYEKSNKLMTDKLFFKVWRNLVIRNQIIGEEKIKLIKEKDKFKIELIKILNEYNIKFNLIDIEQYVILFKSNLKYDLEYTINKYFKVKRNKRLIEFEIEFNKIYKNKFKLLFRGDKSEIIDLYINSITPNEKLKLPNLNELINMEFNEIQIILESLKPLYENEGLEFNYLKSKFIQDFIINIKNDTNALLLNERQHSERVARLKGQKFLDLILIFARSYTFVMGINCLLISIEKYKTNSIFSR